MPRRLARGLVVLVALAFAPAAFGAYPGPFPTQGGQGVLSSDGTLRFVALKDGADTRLNAIRRTDGTVVMSKNVTGAFGVAVLSPQGGYGEGLSHDGRTLVLQSMGLAATTQFA